MAGSALYDEVIGCFSELQNPDCVEETLLELSQMVLTSAVLEATDAMRLIMDYFSHPTCGDLARNLAMDWFRIRSPKMPALAFKRKVEPEDEIEEDIYKKNEDETEEPVPVKRIKREISEDQIEDEIDENEEPVPAKRIRKEIKKEISEDEEILASVNAISEEFEAIKEEEEEEYNPFTVREEFTVKSVSPPLASSYPFSTYRPIPPKTPSPLHSSSSSSSSRSTSNKKTAEDARLEEISMKIAKKKAENAAKHRKTQVISDHAYINSRVPSGQKRFHLKK